MRLSKVVGILFSRVGKLRAWAGFFQAHVIGKRSKPSKSPSKLERARPGPGLGF